MDIFEYRLNMYKNQSQSENIKKAIQIFNYIKSDVTYFLNVDNISYAVFNVIAYLANVDGVVTNSEILFLSDFIDSTEYYFAPGLTAAKYLKIFNNGENEKILLKLASKNDSVKENLQILGMIMYTYDGRLPSKRKVDFLRKLEC